MAQKPTLTFEVPLYSRWNKERLEARKKTLGERAYARGFQQKAFAAGELMFQSWAKAKSEPAIPQEVRDLWQGEGPVFAGVDLSSESRPGTVIHVMHVRKNQKRLPLAIFRGRWSSPDTARKLNEIWLTYRPDIFMVENNGYQQALIDWSKAAGYGYGPKVRAFTTGRNKVTPDLGLPSIEVELSNGAWEVPRGEWVGHPPECECGWCQWDREMSAYPTLKETDTVMAMWFAQQAAKFGRKTPARSEDFSLQMG